MEHRQDADEEGLQTATNTLQRSLRIGELAQEAGLSARTIRFYESEGVLPEPQRDASGYRRYQGRDLERLHFLLRAKSVGLSLPEIREIIALRDGGEEPCDRVRRLLDERLRHVRSQIEALQALERELLVLRDDAPAAVPDSSCYCGIIEHLDLKARR